MVCGFSNQVTMHWVLTVWYWVLIRIWTYRSNLGGNISRILHHLTFKPDSALSSFPWFPTFSYPKTISSDFFFVTALKFFVNVPFQIEYLINETVWHLNCCYEVLECYLGWCETWIKSVCTNSENTLILGLKYKCPGFSINAFKLIM